MNNFFRPFTLLILTPFSFFPLTLRKLRSPWHYLSIFLLSSPSLLPPSFSPSVSSPFVTYALDFSPPPLTPLSSSQLTSYHFLPPSYRSRVTVVVDGVRRLGLHGTSKNDITITSMNNLSCTCNKTYSLMSSRRVPPSEKSSGE